MSEISLNSILPWKRLNPVILLLFSICPVLSVLAQNPNPPACFDPEVKTIQVSRMGDDSPFPVIELQSDQRLRISFDALGDDIRRFRFTVVHCTADWSVTPDLAPFDYIDGFMESNIDDYAYSYNTIVHYIHYEATFPNEVMRPKISGNYLLRVYEEDPSAIVFTARFMVVERSPLLVSGNIEQGERIGDKLTHQQVNFIVKLNGFNVSNVSEEIKVILQQNGRWDNAMRIPKPRFIRGEELDYRYDESIAFSGGNQFRNFDFRDLKYQTERVGRIAFDSIFHVFLLPDKPRTYKEYINEQDLNGKCYIKNDDHAENSNTEADYALVHFFLPFPAVLTSGSFHVLGELTQWQANSSSRMEFDYDSRGYRLDILLKQGYYNYIYVLDEPSKPFLDESLIEGSHWETENDYSVFVYLRPTGSLYDRLISYTVINSRKL